MLQFFRTPALSASAIEQIQLDAPERTGRGIARIKTEWCFYVETKERLNKREQAVLRWLLAETFEPSGFSDRSFIESSRMVLEVGPRLNFRTAWSSTAGSICHACGLHKVACIERSLRLGLSRRLGTGRVDSFLAPLHDRMTQMRYLESLQNFDSGLIPTPVRIIPVIEEGIDALRRINNELGLAMDEQDLRNCYDLFVNQLKRNPTNVELFQLAQSNSEHSRHGFFRGRLVIDGEPMPETLMQIVQTPWRMNPGNSVIAFDDDSSAIRGREVLTIIPVRPGECSPFVLARPTYHPTLTAETHNFPTGVAPFPGAETGTGGRIRDNQAVGRGGLVIAGGAAYCVDNPRIPGYPLPWEDAWQHPVSLASPLDILIRASNGASDYGNKFGEPVVYGFVRSFGQKLPDGRRGWFKPLMFTVGAGQLDDRHTKKGKPGKGMLVVQIGGPAYCIGIGGGARSSAIQKDDNLELDVSAVQRGDAQMEQRFNRCVRACAEMGKSNPFISIHDLGAGGDCNALPELIDPAGALIELRAIPLGDQSLSVLEYWGNESQERMAFLIWPDRFDQIKAICDREGIPCVIVGRITDDGWLILHDGSDGSNPVQLPLDKVLGTLPQKTFELKRIPPKRKPLKLPRGLTVADALERILRLLSVGSKRFLAKKVDRSVPGLVAQQQCVGPNQLTLSDYAVIAQSHFGLTGVALSLGEQPIKGLLSPGAGARMAVAEALLNMVGAKISDLHDIKCSANWMLAAKLPGEGAWLYDAACALRDICLELFGPDGGKDSLSMAAVTKAPDGSTQTVRAPAQLVISAYAPMDDITCKVTPDLKKSGSSLLFIDLAKGKNRLGGSALAQVFGQVGCDSPDVENTDLLARAFRAVQELVEKGLVCSIHDRSDGGLITTLLEMAFAGNMGLNINLQTKSSPIEALFNEELGLVIECDQPDPVISTLQMHQIPFQVLGTVPLRGDLDVIVHHNGVEVLRDNMLRLRQTWEETSSQIDRLQANPKCVAEEARVIRDLLGTPPYHLSFDPVPTPDVVLQVKTKPKLAVLRTEGSNGDREMASAFFLAGFEVWDVTMSDLLESHVILDDFRVIAFVGGFAHADVMDAAKGWAGMIRFNKVLADQFARFRNRPDTLSLGVCNGCQLMALLGWVPYAGLPDKRQPRFIRNTSEQFESCFSTVMILPSPAVMLRGMEHSNLGVWVAHGEGRFHAPDKQVLEEILAKDLAPIRFADPQGHETTTYPFNPNGSIHGITALCSEDGRHLAIMPHPERTFLKWQWPWMPKGWKENLRASPWLQLFQNARTWCMGGMD